MEITLKNFRKYKYVSEFSFRRFTVFTGVNSIGKSTILKALSIIGDSLGSDDNFKLNLSGRNLRSHGVYSAESVFNWDSKKTEFEVNISEGDVKLKILYAEFRPNEVFVKKIRVESCIGNQVLIELKCQKKEDHFEYRFRYAQILAAVELPISAILDLLVDGYDSVKWEKQSEDLRELAKQFLMKLPQSKKMLSWVTNTEDPISSLGNLEKELLSTLLQTMDFSKVHPDSNKGKRRRLQFMELFKPLRMLAEIFSLFAAVNHLSSKRSVAPRIVMPWDESFEDYKNWSTKKLSRNAHDFVVKWIKDFSIGDAFKIHLVEGVGIKIEIRQRGKWINLADKGMGEAQIWRIIFTLGTAMDESKNNPVHLLIEEPDSNLHPAYQSKLVEPILDSIDKSNSLKISIETHSEYMIRNLMLRSKKSPDIRTHVLINYVGGQTNRADCKVIEIQEDGRLSQSFGPGFFDEASRLTMELF